MTPFEIMGPISTIALSLPILLILLFKLAWYRSFPGLLAYYAILCFINLLWLGFINVDNQSQNYLGILNNILAPTLLLFFFTYYCNSSTGRKSLMIVLFTFLAFELVTVISFGLTARAASIITIPGLVLTLGFALYFFIPQLKLTIVHHKGFGKALIVSSLFFNTMAYGYTFSVVNYVDARYGKDAQLVFFVISIIASITMAIGLMFEQKRIRQLEELKTTREELKALYGETEKPANPFENIALNFDKETWN